MNGRFGTPPRGPRVSQRPAGAQRGPASPPLAVQRTTGRAAGYGVRRRVHMRCEQDGWLVGPGEEVADRAWARGEPITGCGNLRCGRCGRAVLDLGQRLLTRRPEPAVWLAVYDAQGWQAWTEDGPPGWRTWLCGCRAFPAYRAVPLETLAWEDDLPWACDGHAR